MNSNKVLTIVGLIATFIICFAIGFILPIDNKKDDVLFSNLDGSATGGGGSLNKGADELFSAPEQENDVQSPTIENSAQSTQASDVSNVPVIEPCRARAANLRFGYYLTAKATVPSGDELDFALCEVGSTVPKYTSTNGNFGSSKKVIVPSATGKYDLIVTNRRTGDKATMTIEGFSMVNKMSASKLQANLNLDTYPKDFYMYLVEDENQKIEYENLPEGYEGPNNVGALGSARIAAGWSLEVVAGSIQYDEYNRIKRFKVKVIES